jgi:HK97 family phage major capsid protein
MNPFNLAALRDMRSTVHRLHDALDIVAPDTAFARLCERVDPAEAIRDLTREKLLGANREVTQELDRIHPRTEGNSVYIPWQTILHRTMRHYATRADIVGTSSAGGYLVQTLNLPAAQALMALLVLGRLGATAVDSDGSNLNLPKVNSSATPYWLTTETTQASESDQTQGQLALTPHTVGGYTEMSRLLTIQSNPSAGDLVAADLSRKIGHEVENKAFAGSGAVGQPLGLSNNSGVNAGTGTSFALATAMTAATSIGDALGDSAGFAVNRSVAATLRQRAELSGSSMTLWRGPLTFGTLADFPAAGTSGIASGAGFFGEWQHLVLANWAGLQIAINPYANFQAGVIGMRCFATVDVGCVWPAAFVKYPSIT